MDHKRNGRAPTLSAAKDRERAAFRTPTTEPRQSLPLLLGRYAEGDGIHPGPWPGLDILRVSQPRPRMPVVYQPCVCVVAQGRKRAYLGDQIYDYDPFNYLVLSVPLPVEGEIVEASPEEPFLLFRLALDAADLSELLLELGEHTSHRNLGRAHRGIFASKLEDDLLAAVVRFLAALDDPGDRRVLAPLARREILYRLLTGEQGYLLRSFALGESRSHRVARVVRYIQENYDRSLDVAAMADVAHMSTSSLHHAFKEVTSVSPLQYLKQIRLHKARLLMVHDDVGAGEAAHRVGYGSPSQFSREFKRLFGAPPAREVERLRASGLIPD